MNNTHNKTIFNIIKKALSVLICAFIFVSNFEITKVLALTHIDNKQNTYGEYYDKEYPHVSKVNTPTDIIKSNGMGNHIHFNLEDESDNNFDNTQIDDSSYSYEYSIDEYTTIFKSSDNNDYKKIEVSSEIVNYEVSDDTYLPIDTTIQQSSLEDYEYENTSNTIESYYPSMIEDGLRFTVKDTTLTYKPLLIQNNNPQIKNNQLIYPLENDINLHYLIHNSSIKENIILNTPIENNSFTYQIAIDNGSYYLLDNKLYIQDNTHKDILYIEAPLAYDRNNNQTDIAISLSDNILTYSIDQDWLNDDSRVYPITIDPSFFYILDNEGSDISILESMPEKTIGLNNDPIDKYLYLGSDVEYGDSYSFYTYANYKLAPKNIIVDSFILTYDIDSTDFDNTINYYIIQDDIKFNTLTYNDLSSIKNSISNAESVSYSQSDTNISLDLTNYTKGLLQDNKENSFIFMSLQDDSHYLRLDASSCKLEFKFHYPTDDNDDYDNLKYYLRPFVKTNTDKGIIEFVSLGIDGSDSLNREIEVSLYTKNNLIEKNNTIVSDYLYNYPNYPLIDSCPNKYQKLESNFQLPLFSNIQADKLYTIKISDGYVNKEESFRLYKVKDLVLIHDLALFYGVDISVLLEDNNISNSIIHKDNILFIRNPSLNKNNDYKPEDLSDLNIAINASLRGNSNDTNSNIIMGNFLLENTDFTLLEADLQFNLVRTYNSNAHNQLSVLGHGFDFSYNSYVIKTDTGAILLLPSGRKLFFIKQDSGYSNELNSNYKLAYIGNHFELLFTQDKTRYIFDDYGSLSKINYHTGKTITLSYKNRLLSKVDLGNNSYLSFSYNNKSLLTKVTASDGTTIKYEYDNNANLIAFIDQLGNKSTYEYDDNHLMISYKDFNDKTIYQNEYNSNYKLAKQTDSLGNSHTLKYQDNKVIFTDSRNNKTIYHYDENYYTSKIEYPDESLEEYKYELGILKSYTNKFGLNYQYTYDSNNNLIKEVRSDGFITDNTYDSRNNLLKSSNSYNQKIVYTYDSNNNPISKTDSLGNTYTYTYNANSKLTSETDPNGNVTKYEYDSNNNLIKVTYPDNTYHKMSYNTLGFLVSLTNEKGHKETHTLDDKNQLLVITYPDSSKEKYEYDSNGNIIKYENRNKAISSYEYNSNNNLIKSIDPKGNITKYEYDENSNLIKTLFPDSSYIINEYDCLDRLIKKDNSGYIEEYSYNHYGINTYTNPLEYTSYEYDYLGNITSQTTNNLTTTNKYDSLSRLIESTNEKGIKETYEYDLNNQIIKQVSALKTIEFTYDNNGNILTEIISSDNSIRTNTYEYDGRNNLIKKIDSLNNEYQYEYDGLLLTKQIDPLGNSISYLYDSNSRIVSITDSNNFTSYKKYDYQGNIKEEIDNIGNTFKYTYDLNDNLISKTNPDGGVYTYEYDSTNKLIKEISPLSKTTTYTYDLYGNIIETRINDRLVSFSTYDNSTKLLLSLTINGLSNTYQYDEKGNLSTLINPYGQIFNYEYDQYNRLIKEYTDENILSSFTYNDYDLLILETDKYGKSIEYTYNNDLNLISKKDHNKLYQYEYDLLDNLIKESDYLNNVKTFEYDKANKLIKATLNDRVSLYEYDSNNNLISFLDSENQKTTYTYDSNNNLINKINNDNHTYQYQYDGLNRLISEKTDGKLLYKKVYDLEGNLFRQIDGENNTTTYYYDSFSNNIAIKDPKGFIYSFEYDDNFNLIKAIDPKENTITHIYNELNQLIETKDSKGNSVYYEYDIYNNISKYINPLGGIDTYQYNYKNQLINHTSSTGLNKSYLYNINNNITDIYYDKLLNNSYIYDDYFRLIEEKDALEYKKSYTYDSYNNIINLTGEDNYSTDYEYDKLDRLIAQTDSTGLTTYYSYDSNDNIISKKILDSIYKYTYDSRNNLIEYIDPSSNTYKYKYDKANRIIKEIDPFNNYKTYKYDENSNLVEESDYNFNKTKYVYDDNNNLIQQINPLDNIKTYTYDSNNNLSSAQDELGFISTYEYDQANNLISIKNNILQDNSHLITYEYDSSNRLIKAISYEGITQEYSYDNLDNLLTYKQGNITTKYSYDLNNNLIQKDNIHYYYDRLNRLVKLVDNTGTSQYKYNSESDLILIRQSNETINYTYTDKHQVETINYGDNRIVEYSYDLNNNISSVKDNNSLTNYTYDKLNREIKAETLILSKDDKHLNNIYGFKKVYADDEDIISTIKSYDNNSNIKSIESYLNESLIMEERYVYDSLNKLTSKYSNKNNNISNTNYKYNKVGQLIESDNNGSKNIYTRLLDGKTISIEGNTLTSFEYNDDGQLIKSISNNDITTYKYDDRGNRISQTSNNKTTTYTYDKYNNLLKITNPDGYFFEYEYDGLNNRVSLTVPYKVFIHPNTGLKSNSSQFNNSLDTDKNNLLSKKSPVKQYDGYYETRYQKLYYLNDYTTNTDKYIAIKSNNNYRYTTIGNNTIFSNDKYLLSDYLGSTIMSLSKDKHNNINIYGYSDYGISNINYNPLDNNSISLSYTGQDISLNRLIYLHSRYYDPITQSFISKDTYKGNIYDNSTLNGYNYCANDPINYIDPTGHIPERPTMLSDGGGGRTTLPSNPYKPPTNNNSSNNGYRQPNIGVSNNSNTYNNNDSYYSSPSSNNNTYTPIARKVSKNTTSSSATIQNNIGLWNRIVNGVNDIKSKYKSYKDNLNNQIQTINKLYNNQPGLNTVASLVGYTSSIGMYTSNAALSRSLLSDNIINKHSNSTTYTNRVSAYDPYTNNSFYSKDNTGGVKESNFISKIKKVVDNNLSKIASVGLAIGGLALVSAATIATCGAPIIIAGTVLSASSVASGLTLVGIAAGTTSFIASLTNLFTGLSKESLDGRTLSEQESKERIKVGQTQALQSLTLMAEGVLLNSQINNNKDARQNAQLEKTNDSNYSQEEIDKAKDMAQIIKDNNGSPPEGYKGGKTYKNVQVNTNDQKLPEGVSYKEYDVNPYIKGQNRGAERIVIGDDGSVWYTNDHYHSFKHIDK